MKLIQTKKYLLLIDEEAKIKEGNYIECIGDVIKPFSGVNEYYKRLSEDKPTYKWNKIIAYYPLSKETIKIDLPLLPNPFKDSFDLTTWSNEVATKQFSLEDVLKAIDMARLQGSEPFLCKYSDDEIIQSLSTQQLPKEFIPKYEANIDNSPYTSIKMNRALKALKESSKIGCKLKTITNSDGKEELVGTYKY